VILAAVAALVIWGRNRMHFDFAVFRSQLALADWRKIAIAIGCNLSGLCLPLGALGAADPPQQARVAAGAAGYAGNGLQPLWR